MLNRTISYSTRIYIYINILHDMWYIYNIYNIQYIYAYMYVYKNKLYKKYRTAYSMHMHITCMHTYIHTYIHTCTYLVTWKINMKSLLTKNYRWSRDFYYLVSNTIEFLYFFTRWPVVRAFWFEHLIRNRTKVTNSQRRKT